MRRIHPQHIFEISDTKCLWGNCTPNQILAYFLLYSSTFYMKNASYSKLSKELKNSIEIQIDQANLELLIKIIF